MTVKFFGDADLGNIFLEDGSKISLHEDMHEGKIGVVLNNNEAVWLNTPTAKTLILKLNDFVNNY